MGGLGWLEPDRVFEIIFIKKKFRGDRGVRVRVLAPEARWESHNDFDCSDRRQKIMLRPVSN